MLLLILLLLLLFLLPFLLLFLLLSLVLFPFFFSRKGDSPGSYFRVSPRGSGGLDRSLAKGLGFWVPTK